MKIESLEYLLAAGKIDEEVGGLGLSEKLQMRPMTLERRGHGDNLWPKYKSPF